MVASAVGWAPKFPKSTYTGGLYAALPWSVDSLASKTARDRTGIVSQHRYSFRGGLPWTRGREAHSRTNPEPPWSSTRTGLLTTRTGRPGPPVNLEL
jgi:hypothetical protein